MATHKGVSFEKQKKKSESCDCCCNSRTGPGCGGAVYGLGFIGALVYYISTASGFWMGALGVLKALVWPAFLVFDVLKYLGI
jgi:hypothetical protein